MPITFSCEGCGKSYTLREEFAGKSGKCKACGQKFTIPFESDSEGYGVDLAGAEPEPEAELLPPRSKTSASSWPKRGATSGVPKTSAPPRKSGSFHLGLNQTRGLAGGLCFLLFFAFRVYLRWDRQQWRNQQNNPDANANANAEAGVISPLFGSDVKPPATPDQTGPIALPTFKGPGPGLEIERGVMLHEVVLGPTPPPPGTPPGHSGKLWLYLPSGDHAAKSLSCVMITGAGSTLLSGMDLGEGDRAEHLPYVRAGFAVLAFELDGPPANESPTNRQKAESLMKFLAARAGLVNAHIALEYLLAKVPQVDPKKISIAGHSSAGTLAVLFAEEESRIRSCIAYAPALDLEKRFGPAVVAGLRQAGGGDLAVRYSPKRNQNNLSCPIFLFHARDDSNIPISDTERFASAVLQRNSSVTLDVVPTGNHYDSMIQEGIPHAIAWLQQQP